MIVISAIFNQMSHEIAAGQEAQTSKEWTLRHLGGGALALARKKNHLALETYGSTVPQFHSLLSREDAKYFFEVIFEDLDDDS